MCRKVKKDVKHSVYDTCREVLFNYKLESLFSYNNTESNITCKANGNDLLGVGLDDVNKLKSFTNPTFFRAEEGDQMSPDDIMQLQLRLRGPNDCFFQGGITFNPISAQHWLKLKYFDFTDPDVLTHHSTYLDNIFLADKVKHYMTTITDPYYKDVYVLGNWGIFSSGVFSNYIIEDFDYTEDDLENVFQGMDFGYEHAQAIERAGFKDGELYVFDEFYEKHRTNTQFKEDAKEYFGEDKLRMMPMTADSANPDKIQEWVDDRYNVEPAKKGPGSLLYGIEYLSGLRIHIHKTKCLGLAREIPLYKRKEDKEGNAIDAFVELNDDGIAALRYGSEFIWANRNSIYYEPEYGLDDLGL
jgi:phage terminase large subunit